MSNLPQDPELRARFQAQRAADAGRTPDFTAMLAQAQADAGVRGTLRRRRVRRMLYASGLAAAAVIAALLVIPRGPSGEDAFERAVRAYQNGPAMGAWRSPTDILLDVPGSALISTVPGVGLQP